MAIALKTARLRQDRKRIDGVVIGNLSALDPAGNPIVDFFGNPGGPVIARSIVPLGPDAVGRDAALSFENGNPGRPIVMGLLHHPAAPPAAVEVEADGERRVIEAGREIVLRCGKSSITLTRAGKIILRGAYLLSRSSGVNRIKGGSVQIN